MYQMMVGSYSKTIFFKDRAICCNFRAHKMCPSSSRVENVAVAGPYIPVQLDHLQRTLVPSENCNKRWIESLRLSLKNLGGNWSTWVQTGALGYKLEHLVETRALGWNF